MGRQNMNLWVSASPVLAITLCGPFTSTYVKCWASPRRALNSYRRLYGYYQTSRY